MFINKSAYLKLCLCFLFTLCFSSCHAIIMTGDGLDTGRGYIKWEQLIALPEQMSKLNYQVKTLRILCALGLTVIVAGVIYQWYNNAGQHVNEKSETL